MKRHLRRESPNQTLPAITEGGVFLCESREAEGPRTVPMPAALGFAPLVSRGCSVRLLRRSRSERTGLVYLEGKILT